MASQLDGCSRIIRVNTPTSHLVYKVGMGHEEFNIHAHNKTDPFVIRDQLTNNLVLINPSQAVSIEFIEIEPTKEGSLPDIIQ